MKKLAALFLAAITAVSLTACQAEPSPESSMPAPAVSTATPEPAPVSSIPAPTEEPTPSPSPEPVSSAPEEPASKTLIAYFSLGRNADYPEGIDASTSASLTVKGGELIGTTEYVAELIQEKTGGDLHQIKTIEPYSSDFDTVIDQNHAEMNAGTLPELVESDLDISQYDTVFIGYPIWATKAPQAIYSFLGEYDLSGKTVIPFCTHDGYGAGSSYRDIAAALPGAVAVLDGLAIETPDVPGASDTVNQWLADIGLTQASGCLKMGISPTARPITIWPSSMRRLTTLIFPWMLSPSAKSPLTLPCSRVCPEMWT